MSFVIYCRFPWFMSFTSCSIFCKFLAFLILSATFSFLVLLYLFRPLPTTYRSYSHCRLSSCVVYQLCRRFQIFCGFCFCFVLFRFFFFWLGLSSFFIAFLSFRLTTFIVVHLLFLSLPTSFYFFKFYCR